VKRIMQVREGKIRSAIPALFIACLVVTSSFNACLVEAESSTEATAIIELSEGKLKIQVSCTMTADGYEYWINVSLKNIGDQTISGKLQYILKTEKEEILFIEKDESYLTFSLPPGEKCEKRSHTGGYWKPPADSDSRRWTMTVRVIGKDSYGEVTVKPSIITPVIVPVTIELPPEFKGKLEVHATCIMPTPERYRITVSVRNVGDRPVDFSLQYILKTEKGEILFVEKDEPWLERKEPLLPGEEAEFGSHTGGYWKAPPNSDWTKWTMTVRISGRTITITKNQPPVASFTYSPENSKAGEEVKLDASASRDSDGEIRFYEWDLNGDGEYDGYTTSPVIYYFWDKSGTYLVKLKVIDNSGDSSEFVKEVNIKPNSLWEKIKKFFSSSVIRLSESERKRFEIIKSRLGIHNHPHSNNPSSDPDFYWVSDDQLLTILKKKVDPAASDFTTKP
jgi:hypothetical protein